MRTRRRPAPLIAAALAGGLLLAACGGSDAAAPKRLDLAGGGAATGANRDAMSPAIFPVRPTEYVLAGDLADLGTTADVHRLVARAVDDATVRRIAGAFGLPSTGDNRLVRLPDGSTWFGGPDGDAPLAPNGGSVTVFPGGPTPTVGFSPVADAPDAGRSEPGASGGGTTGSPDDPTISPPVSPPDGSTTPTTSVDTPTEAPDAAEAERIARSVLTAAGALDGSEWDVEVTDSGAVTSICAERRIPCPSPPPVVTARTVTFTPIVDDATARGVSWSVTIGGNGRLDSVYGDWATVERVGAYDTVGTEAAFANLQAGKAVFPGPQPLMAEGGPAIEPTPAPEPIPVPGDPEPVVVKITGVSAGLMRWDAADAESPVAYLVPTYRFAVETGGDVEVLALTAEEFEVVSPAPPITVEPQPMPVEPKPIDPGLTPEPVPTPEPPGASGSSTGAASAEIVGLTESEAADLLARNGEVLRVVERDGEKFSLTREYQDTRVNVVVVDGRVTAVVGRG